MSALIRFGIGKNTKARIFEQASKKHECKICGEKRWGILVRLLAPLKKDVGICHQCLTMIAMGNNVRINKSTEFGPFSKTLIISSSKRRPKHKPGIKVIKPEKIQCPHKNCTKMLTERGMKMHVMRKHPELIDNKIENPSEAPDETTKETS